MERKRRPNIHKKLLSALLAAGDPFQYEPDDCVKIIFDADATAAQIQQAHDALMVELNAMQRRAHRDRAGSRAAHGPGRTGLQPGCCCNPPGAARGCGGRSAAPFTARPVNPSISFSCFLLFSLRRTGALCENDPVRLSCFLSLHVIIDGKIKRNI